MSLVGVLALQGGFKEHIQSIHRAGGIARAVRTLKDAKQCDAFILPGGESTVISRMMCEEGLDDFLYQAIARKKLVWGTCAGAILLGPKYLQAVDMHIQANAYGSQQASFQAKVLSKHKQLCTDGWFIRAPKILSTSAQVLATLADQSIVAVKSGSVFVTTFHPELTDDLVWHQYFLANLKAEVIDA
jgi:pyridoxal 5'-phosphate synthase pdxT subunit